MEKNRDYFSKYIEIALLNRTDSKSVIIQLKSIFARHGIPVEAISDGGHSFNSAEFETFMRCWDVKHTFLSRYYLKSNGLAERSVKIVKDILKKCQVDGSDPYIALLQLRTTPKGEFSSPSELLMSRKLRTVLSTNWKSLKSKAVNIKRHIQLRIQYKTRVKEYYDRNARPLPKLEIGPVYYKKSPQEVLRPARIEEACNCQRWLKHIQTRTTH